MLQGDAGAQLRLIGATPSWRSLHLAMLAGSALVIVGTWVRGLVHEGGNVPPLVCAMVLLSIGFAFNATNIAYMAGAGTRMAAMFAAGNAGVATIYEATHPIGQMFARFGNLLVAIAALLVAWVESRGPGRRFAAPLALVAALCGLAGAAVDESSPFALAAVAAIVPWQLVTAVRAFRWNPDSDHE